MSSGAGVERTGLEHETSASLALLAAADQPGAPLSDRVAAVLDALRSRIGATGVVAVASLDAAGTARTTIAASGALDVSPEGELAAGARFAVAEGAALLIAPAPDGLGARLAQVAARVVARELDLARREARAARAEDAISAVTHEMNNALTPLLCSSSEPVARDALRLRSLLDTLRQLRGRSQPRELRRVPAWLERAKRLLSISGGGTFHVEVACADAARGRTIGPEQGRLLPAVVGAGFALRAVAQGGVVTLGARVEADRVVLELGAPIKASALVGDLELAASPGLEVEVVQEPAATRIVFRLVQPPRIVVIEGPTRPGPALALALAALGVEVTCVEGPSALERVLAWPEPSAILVLAEAQAQGAALRLALHRAQPLFASRCLFLDESLAPRHYRASPDEVDLAEVLASAAGAVG